MLVYAHGLLNPCKPIPKKVPEDFITSAPFKLGEILDASNRGVVLAIPFLNWENLSGQLAFGPKNRWHALAKPENLNGVVLDVLTTLGKMQGTAAPALSSLILAGHSRAYDFLDPLARASTDPEMGRGALAKLSQVWAFDTTYSCEVRAYLNWLAANPNLKISVFYRNGSSTAVCGAQFYEQQNAVEGRLTVTPLNPTETHCSVPGAHLPGLLHLSGGREQFEGSAEDEEKESPTPEIVLVTGANYPSFHQVGSVWKQSRSLSAGPWRSTLDVQLRIRRYQG
jgi:hypothetical protein